MEELLISREGAVEVITINRPESLNALSYSIVEGLGDRFQKLNFDDDVRAVILTGAGDSFSSGADLGGAGGREDSFTPLGMRISAAMYSRAAYSIWWCEKPVIGAINGVAAGGACNLALSCDMLVASETARFIQVFVRRGLVADAGGTFFLPRLIGLARAKELMFTGEALSASKAFELGIVNKVVPPEKLMDEAMELAQRMAAGPTRAIGMMKTMLNRSFESDILTALDREGTMQGIVVSTADVVEGVTAFMQKREPDFKAK